MAINTALDEETALRKAIFEVVEAMGYEVADEIVVTVRSEGACWDRVKIKFIAPQREVK